jgi:hypothetical protein
MNFTKRLAHISHSFTDIIIYFHSMFSLQLFVITAGGSVWDHYLLWKFSSYYNCQTDRKTAFEWGKKWDTSEMTPNLYFPMRQWKS